MTHKGYPSTPPLLDERAANRAHAEREKERKDAEKRRCDRKRDGREAREKENRARARRGTSLIPSPNTTPEPESSPSAEGEVDYSMLPDPDAEAVAGQSPGQRRASTNLPVQAEGEDRRARSPVERSSMQSNAGTLERASPSRGQTGRGAPPGGPSAGASGSSRAPM